MPIGFSDFPVPMVASEQRIIRFFEGYIDTLKQLAPNKKYKLIQFTHATEIREY
jgi:hypothetical protein